MPNITDGSKFFIKGFAKSINYDSFVEPSQCNGNGEFIAIITDLVTSSYLKIISAIKDDKGFWAIETTDGKIYTLEDAPNSPQKLLYCKPITNFLHTFFGDYYDVVFPNEYSEVSRDIENGDTSYYLRGYFEETRDCINTSYLVKFWTDADGINHGITVTGSHYIFKI